jgi:hypothetical protein
MKRFLLGLAALSLFPISHKPPEGLILYGASHTHHYSRFFTCDAKVLAKPGYRADLLRPHLLASLGKVDHVVALVGINDLLSGESAEHVIRDLADQRELARDNGVRMTYITIPPYGGYREADSRTLEARRNIVNGWIRRQDHIDLEERFADGDSLKACFRRTVLPDGFLHMNRKGYKELAAYVQDRLGCSIAEDTTGLKVSSSVHAR